MNLVDSFTPPACVQSMTEVAPLGRQQMRCLLVGCVGAPGRCEHYLEMPSTGGHDGATHAALLVSSVEITASQALEAATPTLVLVGQSFLVFTAHVVEEGFPLTPLGALHPLGPNVDRWTPPLRRMVQDTLSRAGSSPAAKLNAQILARAAQHQGYILRAELLDMKRRPREGTFTGLARPTIRLVEKLRSSGLVSSTMPELLSSSTGPGRTEFYSLAPGSF